MTLIKKTGEEKKQLNLETQSRKRMINTPRAKKKKTKISRRNGRKKIVKKKKKIENRKTEETLRKGKANR